MKLLFKNNKLFSFISLVPLSLLLPTFSINAFAENTTPEWNKNTIYTGGNQVIYKSYIYEAKWWTQGNIPAQCGDENPWKAITKPEGIQPWQDNCIYETDDQVSYNSYTYKAKWWSKNNKPSDGGPWEKQTVPSGSLKINVLGESLPTNTKLILTLGSSGMTQAITSGYQEFSNIPAGNYSDLTISQVTVAGVTYNGKLNSNSIVITPGTSTSIQVIISKEILPVGKLNVNVSGETLPQGAIINLNLGNGVIKEITNGTQSFHDIPVGTYTNLTVDTYTSSDYIYSSELNKNSIEITANKDTNIKVNIKKAAYTPAVFSPYADITVGAVWDDWENYPKGRPADLAPIAQQTGTKEFVLAFVQSIENQCKPGWAGSPSMSVDSKWGKYLTDSLTKNKIKYTISLGGASGVDLAVACKSVDELANAYEKVFTTYHPNAIDLDIEGGIQGNKDAMTRMMAAMKKFQQKNPQIKTVLTLPTMPEGLTIWGENIVKEAKNAGLNFTVNIMAMDYGDSYNQNMAQYAIQASESLAKFLKTQYPTKPEKDIWSMVEVTPMIGLNDVITETFTLTDADVVREYSKQKGLGGVHMWSAARDNPCQSTWVSPTCSSNNNQTKKYEFMEHFAK